MMKPKSCTLPIDLIADIGKIAEAEERSVSSVVRNALREYVKKKQSKS